MVSFGLASVGIVVSLRYVSFVKLKINFRINVGAAAPAAAGAAAPAAAPEKPKVEEVDALEGGMDMFGGGGKDY